MATQPQCRAPSTPETFGQPPVQQQSSDLIQAGAPENQNADILHAYTCFSFVCLFFMQNCDGRFQTPSMMSQDGWEMQPDITTHLHLCPLPLWRL